MALPHDQNQLPQIYTQMVLCGIDGSGNVLPVYIDHVTGRVLAELYLVSNSSSETASTRALKDGNRIPAMIGLSDDGNNTILDVAMDNRNTYIYTDLITE